MEWLRIKRAYINDKFKFFFNNITSGKIIYILYPKEY